MGGYVHSKLLEMLIFAIRKFLLEFCTNWFLMYTVL